MKKFGLLAAVALFGAPAFAQNVPPPPPPPPEPGGGQAGISHPFYVGVGYDLLLINEDVRALDTGWDAVQVRAGYSLTGWLAVEGEYTFGLNTFREDQSGQRFDPVADNDPSLDMSYGVFVVPRFHYAPDLAITARLGYVSHQYTSDTANRETTASGFAYGFGIDGWFGNIGLFFDATIADLSNEDTTGTTVTSYNAKSSELGMGLMYRF